MPPKPHIIAITGPSCSGKTTIAKYLLSALSGGQGAIISLDDYYRAFADMAPEERARQNFDAPEAFESELLHLHIEALSQGEPIDKPVYDFENNTRHNYTAKTFPSDFIIVEGILALHWTHINAFYASRVFIDLDLSVGLSRRIERDLRERGRTIETVTRQYEECVVPMYQKYILPTEQHCNIKVSGEETVEQIAKQVLQSMGVNCQR